MADIYLDPKIIEDAEQSLAQAHHAMTDSIEQTNAGLSAAHARLDGQTNQAWGEFQVVANQQTGHLNEDFSAGVKALEQIRMLLVEADNRGSHRFQH
jgi:uncharacterized protein YukE